MKTMSENQINDCPCCGSGNIRRDFDFEKINNCETCGAEWDNEDGDITFNPKTDC